MARNMLGFATQTVRLSVTTVPDPPTDLAVYNVSHDSLTLGWKPGFDGGLPATYRLRYRPATSSGNSGGPPPNYRFVWILLMMRVFFFYFMCSLVQEVIQYFRYEDTGNATRYVVTGLELATQYVFSVMAQNRLGASRYLPDTLKATTSSEASHILSVF